MLDHATNMKCVIYIYEREQQNDTTEQLSMEIEIFLELINWLLSDPRGTLNEAG